MSGRRRSLFSSFLFLSSLFRFRGLSFDGDFDRKYHCSDQGQ